LYGRIHPIPVLPEVDFIEVVVSITKDKNWSENEMYRQYSAEDNDFGTEFFQKKCENVFN
jgi:hypothetical protein